MWREATIGGLCLIAGWTIGQAGTRGVASHHPSQDMASLPGQVHANLIAEQVVNSNATSVSLWRDFEPNEPSPEASLSLELIELSAQTPAASESSAPEAPQRELASVSVPVEAEPVSADKAELTRVSKSLFGPRRESVTVAAAALEPVDSHEKVDSPEKVDSLAPPTSLLHPDKPEICLQPLGTAIEWTDTPADAYRLADKQDKLVFLIHVSGNFEIPGFT